MKHGSSKQTDKSLDAPDGAGQRRAEMLISLFLCHSHILGTFSTNFTKRTCVLQHNVQDAHVYCREAYETRVCIRPAAENACVYSCF